MASYLRLRDRKPRDFHLKKKSKEYEFNFNIEELQKAIDAPSIPIPEGLNKEDLRGFILKHVVS